MFGDRIFFAVRLPKTVARRVFLEQAYVLFGGVTEPQMVYDNRAAAAGNLDANALKAARNFYNLTTEPVFLGLDENTCATPCAIISWVWCSNVSSALSFDSPVVRAARMCPPCASAGD
jgi:hypothetical protein